MGFLVTDICFSWHQRCPDSYRDSLVRYTDVEVLSKRKQKIYLRFVKAIKNAIKVIIKISPNPIETTNTQISTLS